MCSSSPAGRGVVVRSAEVLNVAGRRAARNAEVPAAFLALAGSARRADFPGLVERDAAVLRHRGAAESVVVASKGIAS